jgi:hypothetical protein
VDGLLAGVDVPVARLLVEGVQMLADGLVREGICHVDDSLVCLG